MQEILQASIRGWEVGKREEREKGVKEGRNEG
jgi:hypothetical protein